MHIKCMQTLWVRHARTGNTYEGLENSTHVDYLRVLHMCMGLFTRQFTIVHTSVVVVTSTEQVDILIRRCKYYTLNTMHINLHG